MKVTTDEKRFPDDVAGRMSNLLNCVNTEFKTAMLMHLDDSPREAREIRDRIRDTIGRGYLPGAPVFERYGNTLYEIALVAKETVTRDNGEIIRIEYSWTGAGEKYGVPAGAICLNYAVAHGISTFSVLGSTTSKGKCRAPYNRIRVLEGLYSGRDFREADLGLVLGIECSGVRKHLEALARIGFVDFESVGARPKGTFRYQWKVNKGVGDVEPIKNLPTLTKAVVEQLSSHGEENFSNRDLAELLKYKHLARISTVCNQLVRQGCVERVISWKTRDQKSKVRILEGGRAFYNEVVLPLKDLVSNTRPEFFVQKTENFTRSERFSEHIRRGIVLYSFISPGINRKSPEDRMEQIISLLKTNGGMTSRGIANGLGIGLVSVTRYLRKMGGRVKKEKDGQEIRYFFVSED